MLKNNYISHCGSDKSGLVILGVSFFQQYTIACWSPCLVRLQICSAGLMCCMLSSSLGCWLAATAGNMDSSSSFSPESSSRDLPMVSGTKNVMTKPAALIQERMRKESLIPIPLGYPGSGSPVCAPWAAYRNPKAPTMAPAFPDAAEIPWQVVLSLAGKSSAGMMKVVALGPKLEKKKVKAYSTRKATWLPPQRLELLLGQGWPLRW